jgi:hypothetical protein
MPKCYYDADHWFTADVADESRSYVPGAALVLWLRDRDLLVPGAAASVDRRRAAVRSGKLAPGAFFEDLSGGRLEDSDCTALGAAFLDAIIDDGDGWYALLAELFGDDFVNAMPDDLAACARVADGLDRLFAAFRPGWDGKDRRQRSPAAVGKPRPLEAVLGASPAVVDAMLRAAGHAVAVALDQLRHRVDWIGTVGDAIQPFDGEESAIRERYARAMTAFEAASGLVAVVYAANRVAVVRGPAVLVSVRHPGCKEDVLVVQGYKPQPLRITAEPELHNAVAMSMTPPAIAALMRAILADAADVADLYDPKLVAKVTR